MSIYTVKRAKCPGIPGELSSLFSRVCVADYLGAVPYEPASRLQQILMRARAAGEVPDVLLLLQHPPVFTMGRFRGEEDLLAPPVVLKQRGIDVFATNRGGSITYHGPGQLVGYPILNLKENGLGVREYVWKLEEAIIRLLLDFGIRAYRWTQYPGGVWVGAEKICSIGIHVSHYITTHGFALNVNNDLRYFDFINPCGMQGRIMTSISKILGQSVEPESIVAAFQDSFSETFGLRCEQGDGRWLAMLDDRNG